MGGVLTPAQCESAMWRGSKAAAVVRGVWAAVLRVVGTLKRRVASASTEHCSTRVDLARIENAQDVGCGFTWGAGG